MEFEILISTKGELSIFGIRIIASTHIEVVVKLCRRWKWGM